MFDLQNATFDYEPYPIGLIRPVMDSELYERLCSAYPDKSLFEFKPALGNKYSLSEVNNPEQYRRFIRSTPVWNEFHAYVKGDGFIPRVLDFLKKHDIDIGMRRYKTASHKPITARAGVINKLLRYQELSARFEFSMMDACGGHILPHTDAPQKMITLVFSMMRDGEWDESWGGGTDVVLPKDRTKIYNHMNRSVPFGDVEVLKTFAFDPNQCVIFVKTFNSWHSVSPMRASSTGSLRKTLTINIETKA